jgi:hypothetical protein
MDQDTNGSLSSSQAIEIHVLNIALALYIVIVYTILYQRKYVKPISFTPSGT